MENSNSIAVATIVHETGSYELYDINHPKSR